jgi:hypothetical protein
LWLNHHLYSLLQQEVAHGPLGRTAVVSLQAFLALFEAQASGG